jgi:hypothetical protein
MERGQRTTNAAVDTRATPRQIADYRDISTHVMRDRRPQLIAEGLTAEQADLAAADYADRTAIRHTGVGGDYPNRSGPPVHTMGTHGSPGLKHRCFRVFQQDPRERLVVGAFGHAARGEVTHPGDQQGEDDGIAPDRAVRLVTFARVWSSISTLGSMRSSPVSHHQRHPGPRRRSPRPPAN